MAITFNSTFDIVRFIEKNPLANLRSSYQNILINKIKDNFNVEQQQMFVGSFYCFLKFNSTSDFVINFEDVWKWCGFNRKDNAKSVLKKHFKIDTDYKVENFAPEVAGAKKSPSSEENRGGHNKEKILMTINTFKKYCLRADTDKASEIHEYYIKLEEILQQTLMEQTEELQKQLEEQTQENADKQKRIKQLENRVLLKQSRVQYKERNVIYMIQDEFHKKNRIYVIGKAINLTERLTTYNKDRDHEVIYSRECNSSRQMALIEKSILYKLDKYREVANRDRFILPDGQNISLFTNIIDNFINFFNDVDPDVNIEKDLSDEEKREAQTVYGQEYYEDNKEKITQDRKEYCEKNEEKISTERKKYYSEHKDEMIKNAMGNYEDNKEQILKNRQEFYEDNKEHILQERKEYYEKNYKTKIAAQRQEKVLCECGLTVTHYGFKKHRASNRHEVRMNSKQSTDE